MKNLNRWTLIALSLLAGTVFGVGGEKGDVKMGEYFFFRGAGLSVELHPAQLELWVVLDGKTRRIWPSVSISGGDAKLLDKDTLLFSAIREGGDRIFIATKDGLLADITDIFIAKVGLKGKFNREEINGNDINARIYTNGGQDEKIVKISKLDAIAAGRKKISNGTKHNEFGFDFYE